MSSESHSLSRTQSGFQLQHLLWARYISCSRHAEEGWPSAAWSSGRAGGCGSSNVRDEHCLLWCWQMQRCAAHGGSSCLPERGKVSEPVLGAVSAGWVMKKLESGGECRWGWVECRRTSGCQGTSGAGRVLSSLLWLECNVR